MTAGEAADGAPTPAWVPDEVDAITAEQVDEWLRRRGQARVSAFMGIPGLAVDW